MNPKLPNSHADWIEFFSKYRGDLKEAIKQHFPDQAFREECPVVTGMNWLELRELFLIVYKYMREFRKLPISEAREQGINLLIGVTPETRAELSNYVNKRVSSLKNPFL